MIWANLLHLGFNMWCDRQASEGGYDHVVAKPFLRFDSKLWDDLLQRMANSGMNMVVIDLGEGVKYESHPELAVKGSWTWKRLRTELAKARKLGIEPIPKLNFSTAHDHWLGPYGRMVSSDTYYGVCRDLIEEVLSMFERPRLFHLGMDEETALHQQNYAYAVMRQHDLWWHDLGFLMKQVENGNARPWIWSDYFWNHHEEFLRKMPKTVLQSNWYYGNSFSRKIAAVKAYLDLETHGFDQVPAGSNWACPQSFKRTVQFCGRAIDPTRLKGFLQTSWKPTLETERARHEQAIDIVADTLMNRVKKVP